MESYNFTESASSHGVNMPKLTGVSLIKEMDSLEVSVQIPDCKPTNICTVDNAGRDRGETVDAGMELTSRKSYWWQSMATKIDDQLNNLKLNKCTKIVFGWMIFSLIVFCVAYSVYKELGN